MASLRDIRKRVRSLKASQKITRAMQMVAAAKLRRAQEHLAAARPFIDGSQAAAGMLVEQARLLFKGDPSSVAGCQAQAGGAPITILIGSDRGLCGPFNAQLLRWLERAWAANSSDWALVAVGRKVRDPLARRPRAQLVLSPQGLGSFDACAEVAEQLLALAQVGGPTDAARPVQVVYNHFRSIMSQSVRQQQLWPLSRPADLLGQQDLLNGGPAATPVAAQVLAPRCEPDLDSLAAQLVPQAVAAGLWQAVLHSQASEHGARMTAMDAATRNARDLMDELTLQYNRARQAAITRDLMDIVGGAEALAAS